MGTLHLKFYSCLRLRFLDNTIIIILLKQDYKIETNPVPRHPVAASCRILCSNVLGLSGNLSDLAVASSQYDILLCCEPLVSDLRYVSELLVPGFGRPVLSFLFVGDLNGHHQEWLGSTATNSHGVAAFDFATVSGCDQLVVGPTHARVEYLTS